MSIDVKNLTKEQLMALLEFYYVPNYGENGITDVYGIFLGVQLVYF